MGPLETSAMQPVLDHASPETVHQMHECLELKDSKLSRGGSRRCKSSIGYKVTQEGSTAGKTAGNFFRARKLSAPMPPPCVLISTTGDGLLRARKVAGHERPFCCARRPTKTLCGLPESSPSQSWAKSKGGEGCLDARSLALLRESLPSPPNCYCVPVLTLDLGMDLCRTAGRHVSARIVRPAALLSLPSLHRQP